MRSFLYAFAAFAVIGLAYWAYNENYATQAAVRRVDALQSEIGGQREKLNILRAEWAYLNRPDRLRDLADINYNALQLMPLAAEHFGDTEQVAFPHIDLSDLKAPIDLSAEFDKPLAEVSE